MSKFCTVYAIRKGIFFEWNDVNFIMPFSKLLELINLIEVAEAAGGKEEPDDFKTDLWVGKSMLRYQDCRMPFLNSENPYLNFRGMLMAALQQYNNMHMDEEAEEAMDEIVKNLKL